MKNTGLKKENAFLIFGVLLMMMASVAFGDDLSTKFDQLTTTVTQGASAVQTAGKTGLNAFFGWAPLMCGLIGFCATGFVKYKEAKQNNEPPLSVLGWMVGIGFIGAMVGFIIVFGIGLLTCGGSEALNRSTEYWS